MALMRLKVDTDTVDFDPGKGYDAPDDLGATIVKTLDGTLYTYKRYHKERHEVPMDEISAASMALINGWWEDKTVVTFYPDYVAAPTGTISVKIVNSEKPLQKMYPNWDLYAGELILREV